MFNSVTDPTALRWSACVELDARRSTLLETRVGYNRFSQTIESNNKVDPRASASTPARSTPPTSACPRDYLGAFGYIGGVGGYPITTVPTHDLRRLDRADADARHSTRQDRRQLGDGYNHSVRNRARTTRPSTGGDSSTTWIPWSACCSAGSIRRPIVRLDRAAHEQQSLGAFINDDWKLYAAADGERRPALRRHLAVKDRTTWPRTSIRIAASSSSAQGIDRLYNPDKNNFGPRRGARVGRDGRREDERARRLRAHLRLRADSRRAPPSLSPRRRWAFCRVRRSRRRRDSRPKSPRPTCVNPNNSAAGGDYVCLQPGVPIFGSSPTGAPPFNIFRCPRFQAGPLPLLPPHPAAPR